jgi:general secretion pathway protein I
MRSRGFTLLEMMVATLVMGVAVVGALSSFSTSLSNASRLTQYDRSAVLARQVMDELLIDPRLPKATPLQGVFDAALAGGVQAGWTAQVTPFEGPPNAQSGAEVLERIELNVWWMDGARRRTLTLEGYRRGRLP